MVADWSSPTQPLSVKEGENLRLRCQATGTPQPLVEWRREGGNIATGRWRGEYRLVKNKMLERKKYGCLEVLKKIK